VKHERATEEIRELAALYVLGSLTQHEARSFEIHIQEGCAACEEERRRFQRTLAQMGFAAEEVQAPEYLRDLLLARVEREGAPAKPVPEARPEERAPAPKEKPLFAAGSSMFTPRPEPKRRHLLPWILGIALVAAAGAAAYFYSSAKDALHQAEVRLAADRTDREELKSEIAAQKEKVEGLEQIWVIVNSPGARIARLIGQAATPSNVGAVLWDTGQGECLAMGSFVAVPQGKVYQLWFFSPTKKVPVGLIKTDAAGRFFMKFAVPKEAEGATAVVVTAEPDNGSQIPTAPYSAAGRID